MVPYFLFCPSCWVSARTCLSLAAAQRFSFASFSYRWFCLLILWASLWLVFQKENTPSLARLLINKISWVTLALLVISCGRRGLIRTSEDTLPHSSQPKSWSSFDGVYAGHSSIYWIYLAKEGATRGASPRCFIIELTIVEHAGQRELGGDLGLERYRGSCLGCVVERVEAEEWDNLNRRFHRIIHSS